MQVCIRKLGFAGDPSRKSLPAAFTGKDMKHAKILMCASIALMTSIIAQAQVAGSAIPGVTALELRELAALGWSAKRQVLGVPVFNDKSERIGTVDDIVMAPDMARACAIIGVGGFLGVRRSEEHTSELQSQSNLVCRLLLEKKKQSHPRPSHHPQPAGVRA